MIYLDNAAMVKPTERVIDAVNSVMREYWHNPSSAYGKGKESKNSVEWAREQVAKLIGAEPNEIHFTSGATESANILLESLIPKAYVFISAIEHPCVENAGGYDVGIMPVDKYGLIYSSELPLLLDDDEEAEYTTLFIIAANNEIGTIQDLDFIGNNICKSRGFLLASDLTQAFGHIPIDVKKMNISFAFGSGQKIGGLSGCGWLYVAKEYEDLINPLCVGGGQDVFKGGTENLTGIVALGEASAEVLENLDETIKYETELRDYMINKILTEIPDTILIGHPTKRLPNNVNIGFGGCDSESIVQYLDMYEICCSAGSACHTKSVEPSTTLRALRLPSKYINGSVRFSLSKDNTKEEVDEVVEVLKQFYASKNKDL